MARRGASSVLRWRRRRAGGSSSRSCAPSAPRCIWPSRPKRARRGPKRRARTDRADARHLRELMLDGRVPESWIPPEHILELRGACACDYVEPLGLAQSTLSLHLKVLYEAGLLEREKRDLGVLPASRSARETRRPEIPRPNGQFRPFRGDRRHYLPDPGGPDEPPQRRQRVCRKSFLCLRLADSEDLAVVVPAPVELDAV